MDNKNKFLNGLAQTNPNPLLIEVEHAEGIYIYDKQGNKYVDMIAGLCVNNVGHNHPKIINAIKSQLDKHLHVMVYGEFIQQAQLDLSENLMQLLPSELDCVYAVNSGTEANEAAIKLCKAYTERTEIIAFNGAYHGSTNGSLSISSGEKRKKNFKPLLPNVKFIEFNEMNQLNEITTDTAGVFLETIQGDAGVQIPSKSFMQSIRERCREVGALLVLDEIQCGLGRTGKYFAFEHFNIQPDILTLGKSLGGGLPIGALVSSKNILNTFRDRPSLGHITTFGGHPVTCAAAASFCAVLKHEIKLGEVERLGSILENTLIKHPEIKSCRRIGMMFAFDMKSPELVSKLVHQCLKKGLITFWFLSHPNSFRLSPPLTISEDEIIHAGKLIYEAINESIS
ncbi:MAG: aspartate aminotransferase family protein [Crocinitomicaceae bacterium]|nr:aspartate aminotransferase family protein [Crocinitomicaceae bacterium]